MHIKRWDGLIYRYYLELLLIVIFNKVKNVICKIGERINTIIYVLNR